MQVMVDRHGCSSIDFYSAQSGLKLVLDAVYTICLQGDRLEWCEADSICTGLLRKMVKGDGRMRRAMVAGGVVLYLVAALAGGEYNLRTMESRHDALRVLVRLAKEKRFRRALLSASVGPVVVAVMGTHDHFTVLLSCRLLRYLSLPAAARKNKYPVAPAGAAAAVVAALTSFPFCEEILEAGVGALQTMLMRPHNRLVVSQCGGARVLMAALGRPAMTSATAHSVCVALSCLARTDAPFLQDASQEHGGVVLRMVALMDNKGAGELQSIVLGVLASKVFGVLVSLVAPYAHMHAVFREAGAAQRVQALLALPGLGVRSRAVGERVLLACAL